MLTTALVITLIIDMLLCWTSYFKKITVMRVITKPLFCLVLMAIVLLNVEWKNYVIVFCVGLFFSFLGDLFLLMDGMEFFALGLISFLVGHMCNIAGYTMTLYPGTSLFTMPLFIAGIFTSVPIMQAAKSKTQRFMALPVHIYSSFLVGGSFCALNTLGPITGKDWTLFSGILNTFGYLSFVVSDAVLAYHTFVRKSILTSMIIITTYHVAQMCLMGGLIYNENYNELLSTFA